MKNLKILKKEGGYALVEASFIFPIIILIFSMIILIGMYVQAKVALQSAVQSAINMISVEQSDSSIIVKSGEYEPRNYYEGVYSKLFSSFASKGRREGMARDIVKKKEDKYVLLVKKDFKDFEYEEKNFVVYRECKLRVTKEFKPPINLTWLGFPKTYEITASAKAVIQDGDEFIRNTDIALELGDKLLERIGAKEKIGEILSKVKQKKDEIKSYLSR